MLKKIIILFTLFFSSFNLNYTVFAEDSNNCEGVKLNTDFPGVGKCIKSDKASETFGSMMGSLMKLAINIIIGVAFIALIASGVMLTLSGASQGTAGKGKELLKKVVLGIVLLGLSGLILHTINPNFFVSGI